MTKHIREQDRDVDLVIAGNGPLADSIASLTESHVHFVGALTPADVCSLMSNVDIFCYPSTYPEGLPSVLLEAAAHKLAIITSNCAGAADATPSPGHGTIVETPTAQNFVDVILWYCDNPKEATNVGKRLFEHVQEYFS